MKTPETRFNPWVSHMEHIKLPYAYSQKEIDFYNSDPKYKNTYTSREEEFYTRFEKVNGIDLRGAEHQIWAICTSLDEFVVGHFEFHWDMWAEVRFKVYEGDVISVQCAPIDYGFMYIWLYFADKYPEIEAKLIAEQEAWARGRRAKAEVTTAEDHQETAEGLDT